MPITERVETRTSNKARTIYPMPHLSAETEWFYEEAYDMDQRRVLDTVAAAQKHVDQGITCTLFVPSTTSTRTLQAYYLYAYRLGVKTLYYTRMRKTNRRVPELRDLSCFVYPQDLRSPACPLSPPPTGASPKTAFRPPSTKSTPRSCGSPKRFRSATTRWSGSR